MGQDTVVDIPTQIGERERTDVQLEDMYLW